MYRLRDSIHMCKFIIWLIWTNYFNPIETLSLLVKVRRRWNEKAAKTVLKLNREKTHRSKQTGAKSKGLIDLVQDPPPLPRTPRSFILVSELNNLEKVCVKKKKLKFHHIHFFHLDHCLRRCKRGRKRNKVTVTYVYMRAASVYSKDERCLRSLQTRTSTKQLLFKNKKTFLLRTQADYDLSLRMDVARRRAVLSESRGWIISPGQRIHTLHGQIV